MKKRDFVKSTICLGLSGLFTGCSFYSNEDTSQGISLEQVKLNRFLYKDECQLPKSIRLDICNLCQLNCVGCWVRANEQKIKKENGGFGYVSIDTFKNFIDKHPFIREIEISNNGEIFLNPDLDEIIKYAYEKNVKLSAYNGVNLNTLSEKTVNI